NEILHFAGNLVRIGSAVLGNLDWYAWESVPGAHQQSVQTLWNNVPAHECLVPFLRKFGHVMCVGTTTGGTHVESHVVVDAEEINILADNVEVARLHFRVVSTGLQALLQALRIATNERRVAVQTERIVI